MDSTGQHQVCIICGQQHLHSFVMHSIKVTWGMIISGGLSREMLQNWSTLFFKRMMSEPPIEPVKISKMKRIFDHVLQKQLTTNGIKSQHHMKATVYKTIVSHQPILAPGHLIWCSTSQMHLEVRNFGETPQQNEQPDSVDQSALIVSNTDRRPASFIKRPASFIKHEGRFYCKTGLDAGCLFDRIVLKHLGLLISR